MPDPAAGAPTTEPARERTDEERLAFLRARAEYAETGGTLIMYSELRWLIAQLDAALARAEAGT